VAVTASGCGAVKRVTSGDPSQGKALFQTKCASCHTLANARSTGTIGPNLDDAFASDKEQGFSLQTMADVVRGQIAYPEAPMPPNLVEGSDADDVSVYVAKCAANPACGVTAASAAPPATTTAPTTTSAGGSPTALGKQVFASAGCGGCHTLKDAGSSGNVGPNLDQLKPSLATVAHQVEVGGGPMPAFKGQLSPAQIQAVAAYVSSVAGK
jgi:mono/diheme cytochrome c family protein